MVLMLRMVRTFYALLIFALKLLDSFGDISLIPVDLTAKFLRLL